MKGFLYILLFLIGQASWSQDIHYTQLQQTPMLLNPAYTGSFPGWERIGVAHKSQWVGVGTKFHTTSLAVEMNFFKPKRGAGAYMGAGLQLYNDIGGDSKFGTKQALVNLSAVIPFNESHSISGGIQVGFGQRSGDLTGLLFPNQFDGEKLNSYVPSSEINNLVSFVYADAGFGFSYRYGNYEIGFARDNATEFKIGFAYLHANRPDLKYRLGYVEKLYGKYVGNISILKDFSGSRFGIEGMYNQFVQGPHTESVFGVLCRYRLSSGSKTTGLTRDAYLKGGLYYRLNDAISPAFFVEVFGFNFGLSYDVTLSQLSQVSRAGGIEFSLIYTNMDHALFKNRRK